MERDFAFSMQKQRKKSVNFPGLERDQYNKWYSLNYQEMQHQLYAFKANIQREKAQRNCSREVFRANDFATQFPVDEISLRNPSAK